MTRRAIKLEGTDALLEISKAATPKVEKEFIHLDRLPDGTWRLLFHVEGIEVKDVTSMIFVRED